MKNPVDVGPWRGPTTAEWVARINSGAQKVHSPREKQKWSTPWVVFVGYTAKSQNPD